MSTTGRSTPFYSFQNTTNMTLHGLLFFFVATGGLEGIVPVTLPPAQTLSADTVALARTRNQKGTAKLTHGGAAGGLGGGGDRELLL